MSNFNLATLNMVACVINIPFIVQDPTRWWNWAAAVFSFGMAIVVARG